MKVAEKNSQTLEPPRDMEAAFDMLSELGDSARRLIDKAAAGQKVSSAEIGNLGKEIAPRLAAFRSQWQSQRIVLPKGHTVLAPDYVTLIEVFHGDPNLIPGALVGFGSIDEQGAVKELVVHDVKAPNISALSRLGHLLYLKLKNNDLADIRELSSLAHLGILYIDDNPVQDISALSGFNRLGVLRFLGTKVRDLNPITALSNLRFLHVRKSEVVDLRALAGLTGLLNLFVEESPINNTEPISGLTNLVALSLRWTAVKDISPLAALPCLAKIWLTGSQIGDFSQLLKINALEGVYLDADQMEKAGAVIEELRQRNVNVELDKEMGKPDTPYLY